MDLLRSAPPELRAWAQQVDSILNQQDQLITGLAGQLASTGQKLQRAVVAFDDSPLTVVGPNSGNGFVRPLQPPNAIVNCLTGTLKITLGCTVSFKSSNPDFIDSMHGIGYSIGTNATTPVDFIFDDNSDVWKTFSIEEIGTNDGVVVNKWYKRNLFGTFVAKVPIGQHYVRAEYFALAVTGMTIQFTNRVLLVEPI